MIHITTVLVIVKMENAMASVLVSMNTVTLTVPVMTTAGMAVHARPTMDVLQHRLMLRLQQHNHQ